MEAEKSFLCLQPEYVSKFQCDGAACGSKCCKNWLVDIDGPTYQKYCMIEPKDERKRIVSRIKFKKKLGKFYVEMGPNGFCPFLRSDGLCKIQKTWGEDWLSNTCTFYPRMIYSAGDLLMLSLTLTCPVAAKLALLPKEPMTFEEVQLTEAKRDEMLLRGRGRLVQMGDAFLDLQYGAISILQNRALSIDQRLIVLGFFLDQAGDMVEAGTPEQIEALAAVYTADDFRDKVPEMLRAIAFRSTEYVKSMFGLIEGLYGKDSDYQGKERPLIHHVIHTFGLEEEMPLSTLVEAYRKTFRPMQDKLHRECGHILENYLVNEFFMGHYPQKIAGTLVQNYILFVMNFKLVEFMAVSKAADEGEMDEEKLVDLIGHLVSSLDHSADFLQSVAADALKRQKDVVACMKNLLYAGEEFSA